jgi:hypothetical protein
MTYRGIFRRFTRFNSYSENLQTFETLKRDIKTSEICEQGMKCFGNLLTCLFVEGEVAGVVVVGCEFPSCCIPSLTSKGIRIRIGERTFLILTNPKMPIQPLRPPPIPTHILHAITLIKLLKPCPQPIR